MSEEGNIYWASFRAACYAALIMFLASAISFTVARHCVRSHNCAVRWAAARRELSEKYQTNAVVRVSKVGEGHSYYDFDGTKLLLYKDADMKFGPGMYVLETAEYDPCQTHGGEPRGYYSVRPKVKGETAK